MGSCNKCDYLRVIQGIKARGACELNLLPKGQNKAEEGDLRSERLVGTISVSIEIGKNVTAKISIAEKKVMVSLLRGIKCLVKDFIITKTCMTECYNT